MTEKQQQQAAAKFADEWAGKGYEKGESQPFWMALLHNVYGVEHAEKYISFENQVKVGIHQFYGIEINDFAVTVAKTALWIAEAQMLAETEAIVQMDLDFLPLKSYTNIVEGNALRIDWGSVVAKDKLSYIIGNPPFVGA